MLLWPPARMLFALHLRPEFDGGDETVAAVAVDALGLLLGHHAERGQRTPVGRGEGDRPAWLAVVVLLVDVAADALEAVDLAPGRLPGAEVACQLFAGALQGVEAFVAVQAGRDEVDRRDLSLRARASRWPPPSPGPSRRPARSAPSSRPSAGSSRAGWPPARPAPPCGGIAGRQRVEVLGQLRHQRLERRQVSVVGGGDQAVDGQALRLLQHPFGMAAARVFRQRPHVGRIILVASGCSRPTTLKGQLLVFEI